MSVGGWNMEWAYDASTSRFLRVIAHLPVVGIGGGLLVGGGVLGAAVVPNLNQSNSGVLLLAGLLFLVGGPFSLLYLWPILTDPDQRPTTTEFEGAEGFPFTPRSVSLAAIFGAIGIGALWTLGVPFDVVYWLVVGTVFSPILVVLLTTQGRLDEDGLEVNETEVPLARIATVRSVRLGSMVLVWISYHPRSGVFLPRLLTVPERAADSVAETLQSGIDEVPGVEPLDPAVRAAFLLLGATFLGSAAILQAAITAEAIRLYVVATIGGVGAVLCVAGLRGVSDRGQRTSW